MLHIHCAENVIMDWDHVRVFLAVAREGQLLGAARRLGLNHATVARRLDALEADLGTVLFDRRPAGSVLTQAGESLLPTAERMETELATAAAAIKSDEADVSGTVRLGAPDGLGTVVLARELATLAARHPALVVELVPLPRSFSLSRREADVAIGLDRPTEGRLVVSRLTDYTLSVYASRTYLDARGTPAAPEDLTGHVVVTGVEDLSYASALDYTLALAGRTTRQFRCASAVGQREAVRAGAGLGVLHDFMASTDPDLVRVLPEIAFRRSYWMLSHPDTHDLRRVRTVRDFVTERTRERRREFLPWEGAGG